MVRPAHFLLAAAAAMLGRAAIAAPATLVEKENTVEIAPPSGAPWTAGQIGQTLSVHDHLRTGPLSRAAVRLSDLSVFRVNELTTIEILPPQHASDKPGLDIKGGALYFFSREKPQELEIHTPVATGALQGTECRKNFNAVNSRTCPA